MEPSMLATKQYGETTYDELDSQIGKRFRTPIWQCSQHAAVAAGRGSVLAPRDMEAGELRGQENSAVRILRAQKTGPDR